MCLTSPLTPVKGALQGHEITSTHADGLSCIWLITFAAGHDIDKKSRLTYSGSKCP